MTVNDKMIDEDGMMTKYPRFYDALEKLYRLAPTQKNRMETVVEQLGDDYKADAEGYFHILGEYLKSEGMTVDHALESYIRLCKDVFMEEFKFTRNSQYSAANFEETKAGVYHNEEVMSYYMTGLAISQYLWKNHYLIFSRFKRILEATPVPASYLEIGPGHGLYLLEAARRFRETAFTVIDISPVSLAMSSKFLGFALANAPKMEWRNVDIFHWKGGARYDFITMGEVLEHVEDPAALLAKVREHLCDDGMAFITTCANCPAIDHLHLFTGADEIREMIGECGFAIKEEMALPVEGAGRALVKTINYAAVVGIKK